MTERSGPGVTRALADGIARAASAPAVLAGLVVLTLVFTLPSSPAPYPALDAQREAVYRSWIHGIGAVPLWPYLLAAPAPARRLADTWSSTLGWLVFWGFLSGGFFDRLARQRPTRGRGFFGACGAHFPAMLRLGIGAALVSILLSRAALAPAVAGRSALRALLMLGLFAVNLLLMYARVRIVVEDRRSALGAILGAVRFVRRNPGAAGLQVIYSALAALAFLFQAFVTADSSRPPALAIGLGEALVVFQTFLILASCASATALFQSRLAHASYTAAPAIEWPESPAAEAISSAARAGRS